MKRVTISLILNCPDDIPPHVLAWMAGNLAEHATHEFGRCYNPEWTRVSQGFHQHEAYAGPPTDGGAEATVSEVIAVERA